ncbi:hypothetical protein [Bacillus solitudinis]|uniref:hypothetical protein n=1 Tax=Bacillus solitudinis TaxID=2014074 RepID=UPI000C23DE7C|nr:hypothetical protein [Bacillus solitudinis]
MNMLANTLLEMFTPAHRRPVDEHLLRDEATRLLISNTEQLLNVMIEKANGQNKKLTFKRKHKNWRLKIKASQKFIKVIMNDSKHSTAPIHKRMTIVCYRKYIKSKQGVGFCKEATIQYIKDGRAHVRSIKESTTFHGVFFRIHRLDEALIHGGPPLQTHTNYSASFQGTLTEDVRILLDETKRYLESINVFSLDPLIESRLKRIADQASKLEVDFQLLDFEEKHTVRRMLREDIPHLMNAFLSLSLKHQLEQKEEVFVTLSKMELTLIDYQEQLEKSRIERINHLLRLQAIRYEREKN